MPPSHVADDGSRAVVRDALGVGIAVGASGFAFGVTAVGAGLGPAQACAMSLLVFTGASQFALVGALGSGGNPLAAVAGAFFLGVRNAFYGLRLSELLGLPRWVRPLAAQMVIDETTAVALPQPDRRRARIGFLVTGLTLYVLWNLTTLLGALGAGALGDPRRLGLDAAGPAVFLALLAPMLHGTRERLVAGSAVVIGLGLLPVLPAGVPVLAAGLAAPIVLALYGLRGRGARADGAPVRDAQDERGGQEKPEARENAREKPDARENAPDGPDARENVPDGPDARENAPDGPDAREKEAHR
ncbi:AzlC family ABC transporter permease [Wenjunlia tyrosinilytica]|uniref:AzlC family ABC transporter permease n=1 Tax=Wenjunlia tyrosinilytica TaxID=1544741 RepID=UPI001E2AFD1C|nr:AzlC family ABC transporter permease [Wenjunlia tyrosinilytica]